MSDNKWVDPDRAEKKAATLRDYKDSKKRPHLYNLHELRDQMELHGIKEHEHPYWNRK